MAASLLLVILWAHRCYKSYEEAHFAVKKLTSSFSFILVCVGKLFSIISGLKVSESALCLTYLSVGSLWCTFAGVHPTNYVLLTHKCLTQASSEASFSQCWNRHLPGRVKKMCWLGEMKHLALCHTPFFKAFSPAESLMRVHSVGTGPPNIKLWDAEGWVQISVYILLIPSSF